MVTAGVYLVDFDESRAEFEMLERVNAFRYAHALPILALDNSLSDVCRRHSVDMAQRNYFDHFSPDGLSPDDRAHRSGLPYRISENIGIIRTYGEELDQVVDALMNGFINSPDHRRNLLDPTVTHIGIGFHQDVDGLNTTLAGDTDPSRNYRGFGTVLVVQDFYCRKVSIIEPDPFEAMYNPGEFLNMKLRFTDEISDAFIRILPRDESFDAYDVQLSRNAGDFGARFAIEDEGDFTLSIYANSSDADWYYREKGSFELTVESPHL